MSFIGPALPPHLMKATKEEEEKEESSDDSKEENDDVSKSPEDDDAYGPALPPGFQANQPRIIGPYLPPGVTFGPSGADDASEGEEDDDDSEIVGPMPVPSGEDQAAYLQQQMQLRADRMKNKLADQGKEKAPTRESWMLELPKDRSGLLGLEARSFRKNAGPDKKADNSEWTDTPEDKLRKAQGLQASSSMSSSEELEEKAIHERDKAMAKRAAKHANKRSAESLLDMHQKELNKKKKEEPKQRQMFDREKDLQVNRFDEAQKKAVFNKAHLLNDRFSSGGQKYL